MLIYCIKNYANGKKYVGKTICQAEKRRREHFNALRGNRHFNPYLQRSWAKYGEKNFEFIVIQDGIDSITELNEAEKYWIRYLKARYSQDGYNLREGGEGGVMEKVTKKKISLANIGKEYSKKTLKRMSETKIGMYDGEDNPFYGKAHTKESRELMSKANCGKNHPLYGKKRPRGKYGGHRPARKVIYIPTGDIYDSLGLAAEGTGYSKGTICSHCKGKYVTQKFKYINE